MADSEDKKNSEDGSTNESAGGHRGYDYNPDNGTHEKGTFDFPKGNDTTADLEVFGRNGASDAMYKLSPKELRSRMENKRGPR